MSVGKVEANGIVADLFPADDAHAREEFGAVPAVALTEDIHLAHIIGAGRFFPQIFVRKVGFVAIGPKNGDFFADVFDLFRSWDHGF